MGRLARKAAKWYDSDPVYRVRVWLGSAIVILWMAWLAINAVVYFSNATGGK